MLASSNAATRSITLLRIGCSRAGADLSVVLRFSSDMARLVCRLQAASESPPGSGAPSLEGGSSFARRFARTLVVGCVREGFCRHGLGRVRIIRQTGGTCHEVTQLERGW